MAKYKPYEITVESVYGRPEPTIPYGFEDTGDFRPPREGEEYLTIAGDRLVWTAIAASLEPRIILRKNKRKQIILTEVGTGIPKKGQYWECRLGNRVLHMAQKDAGSLFGTPTTIYEREDKEV